MLISAYGLSFLRPNPFQLADWSALFYQKLLQNKGFSPKEQMEILQKMKLIFLKNNTF